MQLSFTNSVLLASYIENCRTGKGLLQKEKEKMNGCLFFCPYYFG